MIPYENIWEIDKEDPLKIEAFLNMLEDLQKEKKHAEANEQFFKTVLDAIPYGTSIVGEDTRIRYMNKTFTDLFGKESIGKKCYEVYRDDKTQCAKCPLKKQIVVGETKSLLVSGVANGKVF